MNIFRTDIEQKGIDDGGEIYELSCFFYAIAGIIRLYQGGNNFDAFNLILQSFISYISDVTYLGKSSIWHPIDRYFAIYTCVYHFYTLKNISSFTTNLLIFIIGYHFLTESQKLYLEHDESFSMFHVLWHAASIFMAFTCNL